MKKYLALSIIFSLSVLLPAVDSVYLDIKVVSPDSGDNRLLMESLAERAAAAATRRYGDYLDVGTGGDYRGKAKYLLELTAVLDGDTPVISLLFSERGKGEGLSKAMLGEIDEGSHIFLSENIFKLWADLNPRVIEAARSEPVFLEEVPSQYLIEAAIPDYAGYNTASAVAAGEKGRLLVALGSICYQVDSDFNIIEPVGEDVFSPGSSLFVFGAALTPGGTAFLKPTAGRDIYKVIEGTGRTMKIRTGIDVNGPMAVLPNGVAVLYHTISRKFVRIEGTRRSNLDLKLGPYTYVYAMAAGPEGNLWIHDNVEQRFKIFSDDGTLINSLITVGHGDEVLTPMSMNVLSDGSVLLYSSGALYKFDNKGILLWKATGYHFRDEESFPMTPVNLAVDEEQGFLYMADYGSNRVLKFYDPTIRRDRPDKETDMIIRLNARIDADPESHELLMEKAEYYLEKEAWVLARIWLEEALNIDPFDQEAENYLARIEIDSLLNQAAELEQKTLDTARQIGPESARDGYGRTVRLYEKILSINRDNSEVRIRLDRFKEAFNREAVENRIDVKPLTIVSLSLNGIFPSLIHYYRDNPVGTIVVRNDLDRAVSNVRASLNLKQFIDFPVESDPIERIESGGEATLDLKILLNEKAFNLREDLPVLAQVTVAYSDGGGTMETAKTGSATMYRRTALTWDDTAKLASFIMPNESIVTAFSHRVLSGRAHMEGLPSALLKAARISDALGAYGIAYVEDPDTPFSRIQGMEQQVDTVRYPRTTLNIRSGDCDDTTALLASLLESSGIATAIMTSPGHVFLAFDTEEPASSRWLYERDNNRIIIHRGTIWIPLETTVLEKGFSGAWQTASEIINRHGSDKIDFVTVADQRESFPPLPLGESNLIVVEPGKSQIDRLYGNSLAELKETLFMDNVRSLEDSIEKSSGRQKRQLSNRLAILHGRFGSSDEADRLFRKLIDEDPRYLPPYLNLGNIYYIRGDFDESLAILTEALRIKPDSPVINLALAKAHYRLGDRGNSEKHYRIAENQDPRMAATYAYLAGENGAVRAGIDDEPPILWDSGE